MRMKARAAQTAARSQPVIQMSRSFMYASFATKTRKVITFVAVSTSCMPTASDRPALERRAHTWYTDMGREDSRMYFEDFMSKFTELPIAYYVSHRAGRDMASGLWYKRHLHREYEVLYLESGDGIITLNREPLPIHSGEVILIPPFVTHEAQAYPDLPLKEHCVCFDLSLLQNADPAFAKSDMDVTALRGVLKKDDSVTQKVIDHLLEIIRACQDQPAGWTLTTRGHLMLMFALLAPRLQGANTTAAPLDEAFCRRVTAYIARHYAENLTSRDVAAELCYSQSYFCRRFKRDFSLCFSEYLNAYRLNVARGLLLEKKRTVTEVASSVGFSSVSYFTRCFQRRFDMLPSDYCE